jgi:hypothetical protein
LQGFSIAASGNDTGAEAARLPEITYRPAGSAVRGTHRRGARDCRRHRRPIRAGCTLAACAAVGLLAAGSALPAAATGRTIRFLEVSRPAQEQLIDHNGNRRPDAGDWTSTRSDLYRWAGSRRAAPLGRLLRICIFATRSAANCAANVSLPDGTIRIQGYVDFDGAPDQLAVVGGTGAYSGSRGTFASRSLGGTSSRRSADTLRLVP